MAERDVLTVPEAGRRLGISRGSAYQAAREGQLPTIKIGKRLLVPIVAFRKLLEGAAYPDQTNAGEA